MISATRTKNRTIWDTQKSDFISGLWTYRKDGGVGANIHFIYRIWPPYLFLLVKPAVHHWMVGTEGWSRGLPLELSGPATRIPRQAPVSVTCPALHRTRQRRKCGVTVRLQCGSSQQDNNCSTVAALKGINLHLCKICWITSNAENLSSRCSCFLTGSFMVWCYQPTLSHRHCVMKVAQFLLDLCHTLWTCCSFKSHSIAPPNLTFPHSC